MSEKLDQQAREQQAFFNTVKEKIKNHQALNDDEIKLLCPVAFKDKMTKAEINKLGLSEHYSFVPTMNVINDLRELGYEVVDGIVKDVALLEAVLGRVIAQQELIDIKSQSVCLN